MVIDLDHMPSTAGKVLPQGCSVWPAFWTVGSSWPNQGEIDIIEYVNVDTSVTTALHTNNGCNMYSSSNVFSGTWGTKNCYTYASDQSSNAGCSVHGQQSPVGAAFNSQTGGGVYVLEWDNNRYLRMFYFTRGSIPSDLRNKNPNPSSWGLPYARFDISTTCDANCQSTHFQNHKIIFDTTLCGDWAGNEFSKCSSTIKCSDFVRQNPSEFTEAYWLINFIDIYDSNVPTAAPVKISPTPPLTPFSYQLSSTYDATNFLNNFIFDNISDPTHGTVQYINANTAKTLGLAKYINNKVYLGVDSTTKLTSGGRKSIRLKSKRVINGNNLVIIDLDHMPSTAGKVLPQGCSVWPSFWTVGSSWPNNG